MTKRNENLQNAKSQLKIKSGLCKGSWKENQMD